MSILTGSNIRERLQDLESYELPAKFRQANAAVLSPSLTIANDDQDDDDNDRSKRTDLLDRYRQARQDYMKRRTEQLFYQHQIAMATTNDDTATQQQQQEQQQEPLPNLPTPLERQKLEEKKNQVQRQLREAVLRVHRKCNELNIRYEALVRSRHELRNMLDELENSQNSQQQSQEQEQHENNDIDLNEPITQSHVEEKEQHLHELSLRKEQLIQQLTQTQLDLTKQRTSIEQAEYKLAQLRKHQLAPPRLAFDKIDQIKQETQDLVDQTNKFKEMKEWYQNLTAIMEELCAMKVIKVAEGPHSHVLLRMQLLHKHQVEITLKPARRQCLRVVAAKFITSTEIKNGDDGSSLCLVIPPLDDLVQVSITLGPVEDVRFLLRETVARIQAVSERVEQLAILRSKYLTKIGSWQPRGQTFGGQDQQVVCSLNEGITVILCLLPDCPLVHGSVYLDQIVGVGGWDQALLQQLKEEVNRKAHKTPVALMNVLVEAIENCGAVPPPTPPAFPQRNNLTKKLL